MASRVLLSPLIWVLVFGLFPIPPTWAAEEPTRAWALDTAGARDLVVRGSASKAAGIDDGGSLALDGHSLLEVPASESLTHGNEGFTLLAWVNPYRVGGEQQMIAAKNRYVKNEREWGVMIDRDGLVRLYVRQEGWKTIAGPDKPAPGRWFQVGVTVGPTVGPTEAKLWIEGKEAGAIPLDGALAETSAPLTFGGVNDGGRIWQNLFGALDEIRLFERPLSAEEMRSLHRTVDSVHAIPDSPAQGAPEPDPTWDGLEAADASEDRSTVIFEGERPDSLACDTTLRRMPDGSWVMIMLGGGHTEPLPQNRVFLGRSHDEGKTWSPMEPIDLGVKAENPHTALVPSELMVHGDRCTLFVATHDGTFADWREWMTHSDDSGRTWSVLEPAPGRLRDRTFIRNHLVTRDGRLLLPFQHYLRVAETREISKGRRFSAPTDPRNGVLMSEDGGKTWTEHGDIRIARDDDYHGWAENNIVELEDGRIAMLIRADGRGVLYYAESTDGGRTWPEFAEPTTIPNPGSKATLYGLGGDRVALLHNPDPRHRSPLALWMSFDGMRTWPYQRVLVPESVDGPTGRLNYPDGFVGEDRRWLHFAFDDNRHRAVQVSARLPELPESLSLWSGGQVLPKAADLEVVENASFHVIKRWEPEVDGYQWLHGVGLAWHEEKLYASFGHNVGEENTLTEEGRYAVSEDGGLTWSEPKTIDVGTDSDDLAVSHGVFLSHEGTLWAFLGAFHGKRQRVHTRAYTLDEDDGSWTPRGTVIKGGFWPMQEPVRMDDGNWILPGIAVGEGNLAAVAISDGEDFTKWDLVVIPKAAGVGKLWGESSIVVEGARVVNIARYGEKSLALAAISEEHGRTWTPMTETDLPMATSKPASGVLSTGQRFLVCSTTADGGSRRYPLTIAVSEPGEREFSKVFVIRRAVFPEGPGESHERAALSYPYAVEHDGKLYIGYSNSGGRGGNRNSAELAILPLESLR